MMRLVLVLCSLSLIVVECAEFPKYITKCKLSDSKLNDCLKEQATKLLANVRDGDENLELPSFNPIKLSRILLAPTKNFQLDLRNCNAYEIDKVKMNEIKINPKFQTLEFTANAQSSFWSCTYKANGQLLNNTFDDRGFMNITFAGVFGEYTADYDSVEINETSYYQVKNDALRLNVDKISFNLTHIDGSDDTQAKQLTKIFKDEFRDLEKEFIPTSKIISSNFITLVINTVFRSVPSNELFKLE